jgi:hypothetical protein
MCGNEVEDDHRSSCPYCETPLDDAAVEEGECIREVNLKSGMPTVATALKRLHQALDAAQTDGVKVVKLVHGYGSTGVGGRIREAVRDDLAGGGVRMVVTGEVFSPKTGIGKDLLSRFPELRDDDALGRGNRGITFVVL